MTETVLDDPAGSLVRVGSGRGARADKVFRWSAALTGVVVLAILAGIAVSTTQHAWPAFRAAGWRYFFSDTWDPTHSKFGILAMVYGTFVVSVIALVIAVPVSISIALFVTEIAPRRIRAAVGLVMDVLAAVPSVVFGLWALLVLTGRLRGVYDAIGRATHGIPILGNVFGQSLSGRSFMTAGLILAVMITPIITSISREVLRTVPINDRNGALALGATRWEAIRGVVLPHSLGGLVGASMLGLGRALGETIAVALVIGSSPQIVANLFAQGEAMPSIIANNLNEASGTHEAALIGLGVVLFVLTILVNIGARRFVSVFERRLRGRGMSALAFDAGPLTLERTVSLRRRVTNRLATVLMGLALLVAAVPLGWVLFIVISKGAHLVGSVDWWTKDIPTNVTSAALASKFGAAPEKVTYGMGPAIYGTLLITALAALFSIPLGVMGAVYLNEFGKKRRFASVVRFFTDVMTGVPSVVMGIFIYTVWVLHFGASGRSAIAGALALGCLMLPIVVRSTEEMLRLVPDDLRQASAALGVPTWRTVVTVVLPAALPGITSGAMLAVARAAGETAPLLFTIGSVHELHLSPFGQNTALSSQIFSNATQPGGTSLAWGAALTLIALVVVLTLLARLVTRRLAIGHQE